MRGSYGSPQLQGSSGVLLCLSPGGAALICMVHGDSPSSLQAGTEMGKGVLECSSFLLTSNAQSHEAGKGSHMPGVHVPLGALL